MDAVLDRIPDNAETGDPELKVIPQDNSGTTSGVSDDRPTRAEAEAAVRTLIEWAGDDPTREGLLETPKRVAKAFEEFFEGYTKDPKDILAKTFEEVAGYDDMVVMRGIRVESHCEHHMVPVQGIAHVAYMPKGRVVGISKLARVVEAYARRLQTQETMTAQIADAIEKYLDPEGVAVVVDATHQCMTCRGVKHHDVFTITRQFRGCFKEADQERRFWDLVRG